MSTFVLVHGAWSGSFGWRKVRRLLAERGHDVFTPSLTGIGERAHLTSPQVDLSLHVQDVVNAVWYEDLSDIVLVGYSYGGMVVTGALDHLGARVKHLVYLDAFGPGDGQSLQDLVGGRRPSPSCSRRPVGCRSRWRASTTTRPTPRSRRPGACRIRSAASTSRCGFAHRSKNAASASRISRRPGSPGRKAPAGRFGSQLTVRKQTLAGATTR